MNSNLKISIIIIGYNTSKELMSLLNSINSIRGADHVLEVIYIDDGSQDLSYMAFQKFSLKFSKNGRQLNKNRGRAFATQEGISIAKGNWFLFVRSNEMVSKNLILEFKKTIDQNYAYAYMGIVKYQSTDKSFEKYLNNPKRGIALYQRGENIHYKYLLFNNSIIHRNVCKKIKLNLNLKHYGGEELDFSSKINALYPKMISACPEAVVFRNNYPSLHEHCKRLEEFGLMNLNKLPKILKLDILNYSFLLKKRRSLKILTLITFYICSFINTKTSFKSVYILVRLQFLTAILKGYHRAS